MLAHWREWSDTHVTKTASEPPPLHGFSDTRVTALWHRWRAVVRMGPNGPVTSFEPWTRWIFPDLHGLDKWTMDTLALLNEFVLKVVHHRQTAQLQAWSS